MTAPVTRYYQVRRPGHWWARFWVTSDGCVSIMSDWGNWGYWWTHPGCELRQFLCRIDDSYLLGKLCMGQREYINEVATERSIKEHILYLRRNGSLDREQARDEWDLVRRIDFSSEVGAHEWYLESEIEDTSELLRYEKSPSCQAFIKQCWWLFRAELRRDIGAPLRATAVAWFRRSELPTERIRWALPGLFSYAARP